MKVAYFDCFSGISGDMILGALVDAGLPFSAWRAEVVKLGLTGCTVTRRRVTRGGISGTKVTVKSPAKQPHRRLTDIEKLLKRAKISDKAMSKALSIFGRLAEAEARAHGVSVEEVHFHEIGAVDSIVDIAGSAIALEMMGIGKVMSSPLNLGSGVVKFSHGTFPVPAPATAYLVKGVPAYTSDTDFELTTPTGAAIISTLAEGFGPMPQMVSDGVGYGAGGKDLPGMPNLLRIFVGRSEDGYEQDSVSLIQTNIDDMDPRLYEHVMERLFEAGALDVWLTPVIMKKSRPGVVLSALAAGPSVMAVSGIIMEETTTLGLRITELRREKLERDFREVRTSHGVVRVKVGLAGGKVLKAVPEYEDVKEIARKSGRPLRTVIKDVEKLGGEREE